MKRKLIALILVLMLIGMLTGCVVEPNPTIKEGRFNFSVTYEHWGETKTLSGVFVCNYAGRSFTLEGGDFTRSWEGHIEGIEHAEEIYNSAVLICMTDDGGEIFLDFSLSAAHMMGEPHLADTVIEPSFFCEYSNDDSTTSESGANSQEIEELYGLKIVEYKYDKPIENSFGIFG
jgi:hypothetical protein